MRSSKLIFWLCLLYGCSSDAMLVGRDHTTSMTLGQSGNGTVDPAHAGSAGETQGTQDLGTAHDTQDMGTTPSDEPLVDQPVGDNPAGDPPATDEPDAAANPDNPAGHDADSGVSDVPAEGGAGGEPANPDHPAAGAGGEGGAGGEPSHAGAGGEPI